MQETTLPGAGSPPTGEPKLPEKIGKYQIRALLGRGSSGLVYKAYDPFVRREVAIKTTRGPAGPPIDAQAAHQAFFTEARAAGLLSHPHIVSLYDAGVENGMHYLVMEYVDGETLVAWCHRHGPRLPLDRVVDIVFKCARALDYSHSRGVLHRDVKPSNIMLTRDRVPKLMDFSVAEVAEPHDARRSPTAVGSPLYMSPEQVQRLLLSPASDLYSLGVVMYQLLTGETPYSGADLVQLFAAIRNQPAPRLEDKRPDLPRELCAAVARLLAKRPEDRYASGQALADDLLRIFDRLQLADANLARRESRDSLRSLRFFDGFSDAQIEEILNAGQLLSYATGSEIVREGEIENTFYLIARGSAEVRKGKALIDTLHKGDCFGEIGFLTQARRTATVVAKEPVLTLRVSAGLLDRISLECQLRFYKVFTQTLIYRLSLTNARFSALKNG
jgi:serine/threonine protein kinase